MFGFKHSFSIPLSSAGTNVIQFIIYDAKTPANTVVERKVIK